MHRNAGSGDKAAGADTWPARRGRMVCRGIGAVAIGLSLAACEAPQVTQEKVFLPASTPRLSASAQREAQLRTGTYRDDIPEYTGAPGPHGQIPVFVPATGQLVVRGDYAATESAGKVTDVDYVVPPSTPPVTVGVAEVETMVGTDGQTYVVLKDGN